jgi:tetratricopeptide (TPR) repeat protein
VEVLRFRTLEQVIDAGRTAEAAGRFDQARTAYERAIQLSPESAFLYRELGAIERRQGNAERALQHFKQAIMLDPADAAAYVGIGDILAEQQDIQGADTAYRRAAAIEPSTEVSAKIAALAERTRELKLPAEFRAIASAPQITRGDLAALIAQRLDRVLAAAPSRQVVITDTAGHWAATWITQVATAGVMDPFENHTFQPGLIVRRGDLAEVVSRLVTMLAVNDAALRARIAAQPPIADMPSTHLRYPAAAVATSAGVMPLVDGERFDVNRLVTGAEVQDVISRLQALSR